MAPYAFYDDLDARLGGKPLTATSEPSIANATTWIETAQAMLDNTLLAVGIAAPVTNVNGRVIAKSWVLDFAEGHYRMAMAAAGGDGANDDGKDLVEKFEITLLSDIRDVPSHYDDLLSGGAGGDNSRKVRGYVLDNTDGKSIGAGDFTPEFTKSAGANQF